MSRRDGRAKVGKTVANVSKSGERRLRAAEALRRNLARRKAQARARAEGTLSEEDGGDGRS